MTDLLQLLALLVALFWSILGTIGWIELCPFVETRGQFLRLVLCGGPVVWALGLYDAFHSLRKNALHRCHAPDCGCR